MNRSEKIQRILMHEQKYEGEQEPKGLQPWRGVFLTPEGRLNPHVASEKSVSFEQQLDLTVLEHDQRYVTDGMLGNVLLMWPRRV